MTIPTASDLDAMIAEIEAGNFLLPHDILHIEGYSSPKVRELLNRICSVADSYIEVGVHVGSTFIPAAYGNTAKAVAIDLWSDNFLPEMLGTGRLERFTANLERYIPSREVIVINDDAYSVDLERIPANVEAFFYDGDHGYQSQYDAVAHYRPAMADRFVLLVDDYNWSDVRRGTEDAIRDLRLREAYSRVLPGKYDGDEYGWWNALYVGICEKT